MLLRHWANLSAASALLACAGLTAGCGSQMSTGDNGDAAAKVEAAAQAKLLADQKACITNALNDAILKQQDDAETQAALESQDLTNCPTDFVGSFVALRTSVRDYLQTQREVTTHDGQANGAAGGDLLNLGCSIIAGKQCAPSAIIDWMNVDTELKRRVAANRTAYQKAMTDIETVSARYGVYISKSEATPPESANMSALADGNTM